MISAFNDNDKIEFCRVVGLTPTLGLRGMKSVLDGKIACAVAFDNWTFNSVQLHIFIPNPKGFTRFFIREVFEHLFITCNKGVAIGITPCNNTLALDLNRRLGFREIARIPDGFEVGDDAAVQVLRRENCKWLRREAVHGRQIGPSSSRLHGSGSPAGNRLH